MDSVSSDVLVVGGGLAGLTAATVAARAGASVQVLEARTELGGRARTSDHDGFLFNEGPHALYRAGAAHAVLKRLGVRPDGASPALWRTALVDGAHVGDVRRPTTLGVSGVMAMLRAVGPRGRPGDEVAMAEWIDQVGHGEHARQTLRTFIRLSAYLSDGESTSAAAVAAQLRRAARGVRYLHGGWATLVAQLRRRALEAGVQITTSAKVDSLAYDDGRWIVHSHGGERRAKTVIIAIGGPAHAARLLGEVAPTVAAWAVDARPVAAACLDVALRRLPHRFPTTALGIDRPWYAVVHTAAARLAPPEGGEVVHAMFYEPALQPGVDHRAELEAALDLVQPGWRALVVHQRFAPSRVVAHDRPQPAGHRGASTPEVVVPDVPGVYVAGDWITADGLLADAAVGSAARAADAALAHLHTNQKRVPVTPAPTGRRG